MTFQDTFFKGKVLIAMALCVFIGTSFAQDLHPSHNAYNSLSSVVDAMKLERKSCAEIGYYPQVGQAICASVPAPENFRSDWDLIVSQTGSSFGLSPLGDWTSEPARGIIHRTYLLGSTDLKVNYDVISSRITIDVLDPELQAQEEARRLAQAEADAAQQQAQAIYDAQQVQAAYAAQPAQQVQAQQGAQALEQTQQTVNGYDVSAAYPAQQAQTTQSANGYYATNADGTTFALVDSTATNTVVSTPQATAQDYAQTTATVESRAYAPAPATQAGYEQTAAQITPQDTVTVQPAATDGYASTASASYTQASTDVYQAAVQTQAVQAVQAVQGSSQPTTIDYAYTPTNLITAMGNSTQNTQAFQPNGAWQITNSGEAVTIELYDTNTQAYLYTVYPDQVYTNAGNYYLSISGNAAWSLSVWTE